MRTAFTTFLVVGVFLCLAAHGDEKPMKATVQATSLVDGSTVIIGRLGKPYGSIQKIKAKWIRDKDFAGKGPEFFLHVTEADGAKLPEAIKLPNTFVNSLRTKRQRPPIDQEIYEGRVYESGGFIRHPDNVSEILSEPLAADLYGFHFYSFLYLID